MSQSQHLYIRISISLLMKFKKNLKKDFTKQLEITMPKDEKTLWIQRIVICGEHKFTESEIETLKETINNSTKDMLKEDEKLYYVDFDGQHQESGQAIRWVLKIKDKQDKEAIESS